ncbi:hypothetical protein ESA94_18880 [Lacibacter luteus]|uniref:Uncharacterized protein n=1 Tax=Lacibacter luteus TaxID=2508719 RepID=A0A4Q1CEA6_9BACT|nr:hypothetical protein [Lacibacter luteus]RXK58080.1 hypothetical protein ESA94_18880 [Lacibacter luteus]
MMYLSFTTAAVLSLHAMELVVIISAAITAGYLLKLFWGQLRKDKSLSEEEASETAVEVLQNKFSAEISRREEAETVLQNEIKAAEKRHMDLQVQYAKALTHIEELKQLPETEAVPEQQIVLHNLQEKIIQQERNLLEAEQKLRMSEQQRTIIDQQYRELMTQHENEQSAEETEKPAIHQLHQLLAEKQVTNDRLTAQLEEAQEEIQQLQQQLINSSASGNEQHLQQQIMQLKEQLKEAAQSQHLSEEMLLQKAGITATRIQASQVAEKVEQFRDHLTAILRDTYSYEQLLASNERLNESIARLQQEKRTAEDELQQLQPMLAEKEKLEEEVKAAQESMRLKEDAWMEQTGSWQSSVTVLQEQAQQKEQAIEELLKTKHQQKLLIDELQHKLQERERLSKEMLLVMKDIETRFAHFQTATEGQPVINGNGHMQYQ